MIDSLWILCYFMFIQSGKYIRSTRLSDVKYSAVLFLIVLGQT
jgi:hypothetical protein